MKSKRLRGIAMGMATHCLSRNNDIYGSCGVGVIYTIAMNTGEYRITINCDAVGVICPELELFRHQFYSRFLTRESASEWNQTFVDFEFRDEVLTSPNHHKATCVCSVSLISSHGALVTATSSVKCYPS